MSFAPPLLLGRSTTVGGGSFPMRVNERIVRAHGTRECSPSWVQHGTDGEKRVSHLLVSLVVPRPWEVYFTMRVNELFVRVLDGGGGWVVVVPSLQHLDVMRTKAKYDLKTYPLVGVSSFLVSLERGTTTIDWL